MPETAREILSGMKSIDIRNVELNDLQDIRYVKIDSTLTTEQKMTEYIKQIRNPYCYKYGKYIIKITYTEGGGSLNEILEDYLKSLV